MPGFAKEVPGLFRTDMTTSAATASRHNEYILQSLKRVSAFYGRRRSFIIRVCYVINMYLLFNAGAKSKKRQPKKTDVLVEGKPDAGKKLGVWEKMKQSDFVTLLKGCKNNRKSMFLLVSQMILILFRGLLTVKIANLDGQLVSSLVSKRFRRFFKLLSVWLIIGLPVSVVESSIEKVQDLLALSLRSSVTDKLLSKYLPSNGTSIIYQLTNSQSSTVGDANHRLTTITDLFATSCSILPAQLMTPILDIILTGQALNSSSEHSSEGAILLGLIANISTLALRIFTPNFSKLTSMRNALENKFHTYHSNIIHNVEEIALAKGHRREIDLLDTSYLEFEKFSRMELRRMAIYNFAVSFIFKYSLGAFGLLLCSTPIFMSAYVNNFQTNDALISNLSSDFVTNRRLLMSASESLGELIQSKKNIQNMLSYTKNLESFEKVLDEINDSIKIEESINTNVLHGPNVKYGDEITFDKVPLITPHGNLLVEDLSFSIKKGQNLLIIGPNGCGKSSLFRILGGLWEIRSPGSITIPENKNDLFYLPQRSYLTYGSLREQIIYPDSFDDYLQKVNDGYTNKNGKLINDEYLIELLTMVNLDHLIDDQYDSTDSENDSIRDFGGNEDDDSDCKGLIQMLPILNKKDKWGDILSVGEQQRLAMVRLYYHCPKFAVLDECTSWISNDLEDKCYDLAINQMGITVISVCHRTSLWKFHNHILKFKRLEGEEVSTTTFTEFNPIVRLERHEEMIKIEHSIKKSEDLQKRLQVLQRRNQRSGSRSKFLMNDEDDEDDEDEEEENL